MTDDTTSPLTMVGSADADVCEGEFCLIPAHHEQAVVNRQLDGDLV